MKKLEFSITIKSAQRPLVSIDSFTLFSPGINLLFGESGIGKTLMAQAIYGLSDPQELEITINNQQYYSYINSEFVCSLQKNSFFVFQEPSSHLNPLLTLERQIREGSLTEVKNERQILKTLWSNRTARQTQDLLKIYPKPYRPSGGEKQSILLAMAFKKISLLKNPFEALFIFDEPTGNLDDAYRNRVLKLLLKYYRQQPFTILFITHDYSIISELFSAHSDLMEFVFLRELKRSAPAKVFQDEFTVNKYLNWLGSLRAANILTKSKKKIVELSSEFRAIGKTFRLYEDSAHRRRTSLVLRPGELLYLKAPSGGGKTTLAKVILGLIKAEKLDLRLCEWKITAETPLKFWQRNIWGKRAAMVFQHADETLDRQTTVIQAFGGLPLKSKNPQSFILSSLQELFEETIDEKFLTQKVALLSGGQKQKLNILRALILKVDLIILDEPLNGLDFASIDKVLAALEQKRSQGSAILLISHNEDIFNQQVFDEQTYYLKISE